MVTAQWSAKAWLFAGFAILCLLMFCASFLAPERWRSMLRWLAVACAGQVCGLGLLGVGSANVLQRFHSWETLLFSWRAIFLGGVAAQWLISAWGLRAHWPEIRPLLSRMLRPWQWLLLLGLLAYSATPFAPGESPVILGSHLLGMLLVQASRTALGMLVFLAGLMTLTCAALAFPADSLAALAARYRACHARAIPLGAALWVTCIASTLSFCVFERLPHVPDEVGYVFMSKYLAQGKLWIEPPPEPAAFTASFLVTDGGRWFSAQLPGWPAMLALGARFEAGWLVNPILGGLGILLAHALLARLFGRTRADAAVFLLALSPWVLWMSASMMPHPASLAWSLAALLGVHGAREHGSIAHGALAGVAVGALLFTRPLEAVIIAAFAGIWWLCAGWQRLRIAPMLATLVCGLAMTAMFLSYNRAITGNAFNVPFGSFQDQPGRPGPNRLGFGPEYGNFGWTHLDPFPGHGLRDVMVNTNHNLYMVQFELFGWACGSLLFVFLLLAWQRLREHLWLWSLLALLWAGLNTYWFSGGPDFGARYWYQMLAPLAVLTVRGAGEAVRRLEQLGVDAGSATRVWAMAGLASVMGAALLVPWRAVDKYSNYREVRGDVRALAAQHNFGRSLVLVRGEEPVGTFSSSAFYSAFALNPARFDRDAPGSIYALDLGPESRERLRAYYSDRPVWILGSPAVRGGGFGILHGPVAPGERIPD